MGDWLVTERGEGQVFSAMLTFGGEGIRGKKTEGGKNTNRCLGERKNGKKERIGVLRKLEVWGGHCGVSEGLKTGFERSWGEEQEGLWT